MITAEDLIVRFGKQELTALTDKDGLQTLNLVVLNTAIADAVSLVASYLGTSDLGAVGATNPALSAKVCDITRFYLSDDNITDTVKYRYDEAIDWLKQVQLNPAMLGAGKNGGHIAVMTNPTPSMWADSPLNDDDPVYY